MNLSDKPLLPAPLFLNKKEFIFLSLILIFIILSRLFWLYLDFNKIKQRSYVYENAKVIRVFKKPHKNLYKLKTKNFNLYLSSKKETNVGDIIRIKYKLKESSSFLDFLKSPFVDGKIINIKRGFNKKAFLNQKIVSQHKNQEIASFYKAIFFAEPIDKNLREKIANLGLSHLIALSGFHLSILWGFIFALLYPLYSILHFKLFPWRHKKIDLGFISLLLLAIYLLYVDMPPSLIRSYFMLFIIWLSLTLAIEIISFEFLGFVTLLILAIFPKLLFSIGFWLSIAGVFYIFLILKHIKAPKRFIALIAIPFGVFILIFPIAHFFFGNFSLYQLYSPLISLIFTIFYPISIILHLIGYGYLFDTLLEKLFNLGLNGVKIELPTRLFMLYLISSIGSIFNKKIFYTTLVFAFLIFLYSIYLTSQAKAF